MALRVGQGGPSFDVPAEPWLLDALRKVDMCMAGSDELGMVLHGAFPLAVNNQLRTGADKGNPTV